MGAEKIQALQSVIQFIEEENISKALQLGNALFDTECSILSKISNENYHIKCLETLYKEKYPFCEGQSMPVKNTVCEFLINNNHYMSVLDLSANPNLFKHPSCKAGMILSYFGGAIIVDKKIFGTIVFFSKSLSRSEDSSLQLSFITIIARYISAYLSSGKSKLLTT